MSRYTPTRRSYDLFDGMFDDFFNTPFIANNNVAMRTDIHESEHEYTLDIELPGYNKQDVRIELEKGYLTISAKHETTDEERDSKGNIVKNERYFGSCSRSFYVGDNVSEEDIKAKFDNGILEISVPKDKEKIPTKKTIAIE